MDFKKSFLAMILFVYFFLVGCSSQCPPSCDDGDECTTDNCAESTNFTCLHTVAVCDDQNACTSDNCLKDVGCSHTNVTPCKGNGICEKDEYGSNDCPDCNDNHVCTKDSFNYTIGQCFYEQILPCCGNDKKEKGETCLSCPEDVECAEGEECCYASCKKICSNDADCVSKSNLVAGKGVCVAPGACDSYCKYLKYSESDFQSAIDEGVLNRFDLVSVIKQNSFIVVDNYTAQILTPYSYVMYESAEKAKNYEEFTDTELNDLKKSFDSGIVVIVKPDVSASNSYNIGGALFKANLEGKECQECKNWQAVLNIKNVVIQTSSGKIYHSTSSNTRSFAFNCFNEIWDQTVEIVFIYTDGEFRKSVNMKDFK